MTGAQISFGRFCIILLAVEWILFGSMHFSLLDETIRQVPDFVPEPWKRTVAVVTGMAEVAIGMLVLPPRTRRPAAMASLALIVIYAPAVYKILAYQAGTPADPGASLVFRIAVVPNNIFLAIASIFVIEHPALQILGPAAPAKPLDAAPAVAMTRLNWLIAGLMLMANCAGFLTLTMSLPRVGTAFLWAMMCIAVGALVGFLFGVPRVNPSVAAATSLLPNTNVEAVSDWLTKILVGVGLVNFNAIGGFVDTQADQLGRAIGAAKPVAVALIVYFFVVGIIQGYILTRVVLSRHFALLEAARSSDAGAAALPG